MKTGSTPPHPMPGGPQSRYSVTAVVLAFTALAYSIHAGLFLFFSEPAPWETVYILAQNSATAYGRILNLWCGLVGESLLSARVLSGLCGLGALLLTARLAVYWGGDGPAAAALTVGFVLFPVSVYSLVLASPDAVTAFLFILAVTAVSTPSDRRVDVRAALAGLPAGLLPALSPLGWVLTLAIFLVMVTEERAWRAVAFFVVATALTVLGLAVCGSMTPVIPPSYAISSWTDFSGGTTAADLAVNYAMLWVALAFSLLALLASKKLTAILGKAGRRRQAWLIVSCCIAVSARIWGVVPSPYPETLVFSVVMPLGFLAALPLALWVRRVMPELKSIAVWIALPVIMYSCFWVTLWPIDLNGFPYDTLTDRSLLSGP